MPDWLALPLVAAFGLVVIVWIGWRNTNRQIEKMLSKRRNLTRAEFLELMTNDVSKEASEFIWDQAMPELELFKQPIALHPDDDLVGDLPLADEDWSMVWPGEWAEQKAFHSSNFPDWPPEWPATIGNYGRWLDMGARY